MKNRVFLYRISFHKGTGQRHVIRVFDFRTDGYAMRKTGYHHVQGFNQFGKIHCRRVPRNVGVGGYNHFLYAAFLDAHQQFTDTDVVWPYP